MPIQAGKEAGIADLAAVGASCETRIFLHSQPRGGGVGLFQQKKKLTPFDARRRALPAPSVRVELRTRKHSFIWHVLLRGRYP